MGNFWTVPLPDDQDEERLGAVGADNQALLDVCSLGWPGYEVAAPQTGPRFAVKYKEYAPQAKQ